MPHAKPNSKPSWFMKSADILLRKLRFPHFYTEKCIQKYFCQFLCSGRVAQWSSHWSSDLKVPGSTPPWGKLFFLLFLSIFCKMVLFLHWMLKTVICEIPFVLKLNRMLNMFTSSLNMNINVFSKDVSQIQKYFGFNWLISGRI